MARMFNPPHPGAVLQEWLTEVSVTEAAGKLVDKYSPHKVSK